MVLTRSLSRNKNAERVYRGPAPIVEPRPGIGQEIKDESSTVEPKWHTRVKRKMNENLDEDCGVAKIGKFTLSKCQKIGNQQRNRHPQRRAD